MPFKRRRRFRKKRRGRRRYSKRGHKGNRGSPRYLKYYGKGWTNGVSDTLPQQFQVKMVFTRNFTLLGTSNYKTEEYNPSNYLSPRSGDTRSYKLFDHLVDLYEIFIPLGFKVVCKVVNMDVDPAVFGMYFTGQSTTVAGDFDEATQQKGCVWKIISGVASGNNWTTVSSYASQKSIAGVNPLYEEEYWSNNGEGSTRSTKLHIFGRNLAGLTDVNIVVSIMLCTYTRMMTRDFVPVVNESAFVAPTVAAPIEKMDLKEDL